MSTYNIDPAPEARPLNKQRKAAEKEAKGHVVKHVVIIGAGAAGMVCKVSSARFWGWKLMDQNHSHVPLPWPSTRTGLKSQSSSANQFAADKRPQYLWRTLNTARPGLITGCKVALPFLSTHSISLGDMDMSHKR